MNENEIMPPALRGPVIVFSQRMEIVLREHDHKGGWENCSPGLLIDRIGQELREVRRAYRHWVDFRDFQNTAEEGKLSRELQRELTDVANFCMMASDVLGNARKVKAQS